MEIGPKDIAAGQAVLVRRDTREKRMVKLEELAEETRALLEAIQADMLLRAREHRDSHTYTAHSYEELKEIAETKPGFIKMMWCGDQACEEKVKEDTTATSRCMPFEQEAIGEVCPVCGKKAKAMVYWGKAY